ncbi:unnamed protein product, partial [Mesorhabditis belari]|uniref:C-type lectin domain-containing protein n=1 Tax=Mesorhabditis belari TaxID=2138241 RepID=A0AAF3EKF5_9BILA
MRALNFFIFVSFFYSTSSFSCPNGYIQIPNEHKCVYAQNNSQYYPRAVRECNKLGGDVVKIENIFENSILFGLLGEYFNEAAAYIGVEKLPNGTWVYSDGARLTYTNWAPGQPTSTINATICAIIDPQTAQWRAAECSIARPFYCQIDGNQAECDPGWVYFDKTDSCYYLHVEY